MSNPGILIVTEVFFPEEFNINDVALQWKSRGYDVGVLTVVPTYPESVVFDGYQNKFYQKEIWQGINIYRVKSVTGYSKSLIKKLLKYFVFMIGGTVAALFLGKKYDCVLGFNTGPLTAMLPVIVVRKLYKKPVTLWTQDVWPDSVYAYGFKKNKILSFFLNKFVKFVYQNIDNIAISCKGFESKLQLYVKNDLIFNYLPNWAINLDMSLNPERLSKSTRVHFTFTGNIGKVQNLENIIKAFNDLNEELSKVAQLNIIGDGSELKKLKAISATDNIIFYGRRPRSEMIKYYKASDFLIISLIDKPIFSVTVPGKFQTYISAKKPILAIINGDTADIVKDNNLGLVANPSDIKSIKNIFIKAIGTDKDVLVEFTKNCDRLSQGVFNKDVIIDRLLNLTIRSSL